MPFSKYIRTLKEFEAQKDKILLELVKENEAEVLDLNLAQLEAGKESTGNEIRPLYRPITIEIKKISGQPYDRVTLKDSGDFHQSFFIAYGSNSFSIGAIDEKTESLERKYGKDIFGLSSKSVQDLIEMIKPDFLERFRKAINE